MAKAFINEDRTSSLFRLGAFQNIPNAPPDASQVVTFTTSTKSTAFAARTDYIEFICDAAAHYKVGADPTATTSDMLVAANERVYRKVTPGHKIAFVTAA